MPVLRQNIITGDYSIIAPARAKRPHEYVRSRPPKAPTENCPFCPGSEALKSIIKDASTKNVFVIPNKYPVFTMQEDITLEASNIYYSTHSLGAHEVIIFKDHFKSFSELTANSIDEILSVYQNRIRFYYKDPDIEYVMLIHNHGPESGATVAHPHSQLFASSIIPTNLTKEIEGAEKYFKEKKNCVYCDIIKEEKNQKVRVIDENEDFIAFTFFAARFPFEIWILPKDHLTHYENIQEKSRMNLAEIMHQVLAKLDLKIGDPGYNLYIHSLPPDLLEGQKYYHFHIEITPRLSFWGGFELGAGIPIDVVSPEKAAMFLKQK
jgi:UDPglucose--hexose-1-phosphate uridylyltransferase